jgi:hypothetical protein
MMMADDELRKLGVDIQINLVAPTLGSLPMILRDAPFIITVPQRLVALIADAVAIRTFACPVEIPILAETMSWHKRWDRDGAHLWLRNAVAKVAKALPNP